MNLRQAHRRIRIAVIVLTLCAQLAYSQEKRPSPQRLEVPFIGCKSDGQAGPVDAPTETSTSIRLDQKAGPQLAYYKAEQGPGVLAPRGWYCFGTYGSAGEGLYVSPTPIDIENFFSAERRFSGPLIHLSYILGRASGRFAVAAFIARIFPYQSVILAQVRRADPDMIFPSGPYPSDRLMYKSKAVVEYETPPWKKGLGTELALENNSYSIHGVSILVGATPDVMHLAVRVPANFKRLTATIVRQVEQEALTYRE